MRIGEAVRRGRGVVVDIGDLGLVRLVVVVLGVLGLGLLSSSPAAMTSMTARRM